MIPSAYITEWRNAISWSTAAQVEQDLIVSRALVEIFSHPLLIKSLAFRGGTALHKLFIQPAARYSEDIDLVQIQQGSIGAILDALRKQLNTWLGEPKWKHNEGRVVLIYRFNSEEHPITPMRLKIEINTREHFSIMGLSKKIYDIKSSWFSGQTEITTYHLEELLGTKLRALYQRKKGRDLFDLIIALKHFPKLKMSNVVKCFELYMSHSNTKVSRAEFEANLREKINDTAFVKDVGPLLPKTLFYEYDPLVETEKIIKKIIVCLK